jgi:hypothetical protein
MKICTKCKIEKPFELFHKHPTTKLGVTSACKECMYKTLKDFRKTSEGKEKAKEYRRKSLLKSRYGITAEEYDALLEKQNGKCAICGSSNGGGRGLNSRLAVDHNHSTGEVRGLLCSMCNQGIGMFKDNPEILEIASSYLKEENKWLKEIKK